MPRRHLVLTMGTRFGLALCAWFAGVRIGASQTDSAPLVESHAPQETTENKSSDLLDMNLEQLSKQDVVVPSLSTPVSTVSRQESTVGRSPAAVFVVTPEMIRRSGAQTIPDVLRMVPGLQVANVNQNSWAVSSRGFNDRFANKLLVQIDGRVVYSPLWGGVYWDAQEVILEDVERIEVVRGPGATVWGSNAVNGVINIITKDAQSTQGTLLNAGGGNVQRGFSSVRYGAAVNEDLHWRAYGKQFERGPGFSSIGEADDWRQGRGGFRADWTPGDDTITLQGDIYDGSSGTNQLLTTPVFPFQETVATDDELRGGNVLFRWARAYDEHTGSQFQCYYDNTQRHTSAFNEDRDTVDFDYQYRFPLADRHELIAGCGYRRSEDETSGPFGFSLSTPSKLVEWTNVFVQDEITLDEDRWYLTLGSKFEYMTFSDWEVQPTARLLFLPSKRASCWASVSRAARSPTRTETNMIYRNVISAAPPTFTEMLGNPNLEPEDVVAYELGYRAAPADEFSWDAAVFYNDYHNLVGSTVVGPPFFSPPGFFVPLTVVNDHGGETYGLELTSTWKPRCDWELFGAYTYLQLNLHDALFEGSSPHNQFYARSSWNLCPNTQFDLIGRYVDNLSTLNIPRYVTMDARLAYSPTRRLELAMVGQNLLDDHHPEFVDVYGGRIASEVPRGLYGMLTWTY
jgi:iron complex outermembrane recepter protein